MSQLATLGPIVGADDAGSQGLKTFLQLQGAYSWGWGRVIG
jgi:hypothetical protein